MAQPVSEIMSRDPATCTPDTTLDEVAGRMRDEDIGAIVVLEADRVTGIVTDRDIVVRAIAEGRDPRATTVGDVASKDLTLLSPGDDAEEAARKMRAARVRRLPVVENGRPVGVVSIGDLAIERDPESALADISAASPNK